MFSKRHQNRSISEELKNILFEISSDEEDIIHNEENDINIDENNTNSDEIVYENLNNLQSEEADEENFISDIKNWAVSHNITRESLNSLLKVLKKWHINVPVCSETIIERQACVIRTISPGSYVHLGVKNQLNKVSRVIKNMENVVLDIGVDGLPLYKSSQLSLWPILGRIIPQLNTDILLFGVYVGKTKPFSVNCYLHDFATEMRDLISNGVEINGKMIGVKIRACVCDSPANAFLCQTLGHNALNGCGRCLQKGKTIENTTVYTTAKCLSRTDEDFALRKDKSFHKSVPDDRLVLEDIGIDMISQFPLDAMHLIDLGIVKKMLVCILKGQTRAEEYFK